MGINDPDTTMLIAIELGEGNEGWEKHEEIRSGFEKIAGLDRNIFEIGLKWKTKSWLLVPNMPLNFFLKREAVICLYYLLCSCQEEKKKRKDKRQKGGRNVTPVVLGTSNNLV